jgi:outer membrane protein OmpA-like peptidoglycan-associated protein
VTALLLGSVTIAPSLHNGDALTAPEDSPLPAQTPQFRMQRQQGELSLTGHTSSLRHEQTLLNVAESSYPDSQIVTEFQALGIVPAYWAESTVLLLKLLKYSSAAEAIMSPGELGIRSVIIDEPVWRNRLEEFREAMPADVAISSKTILVDPTIDISAICARASESFELGRINFEKSSVEFRGSAYPRLDRLIAFANACYDSQILITGHTDASGDEAWNRVLSRRRANAVGDYVANAGISRDRLEISGVGSQEPVADDSTRYGRSLNRRIEVEMSFKD